MRDELVFFASFIFFLTFWCTLGSPRRNALQLICKYATPRQIVRDDDCGLHSAAACVILILVARPSRTNAAAVKRKKMCASEQWRLTIKTNERHGFYRLFLVLLWFYDTVDMICLMKGLRHFEVDIVYYSHIIADLRAGVRKVQKYLHNYISRIFVAIKTRIL